VARHIDSGLGYSSESPLSSAKDSPMSNLYGEKSGVDGKTKSTPMFAFRRRA
jgi:hypothetical protein